MLTPEQRRDLELEDMSREASRLLERKHVVDNAPPDVAPVLENIMNALDEMRVNIPVNAQPTPTEILQTPSSAVKLDANIHSQQSADTSVSTDQSTVGALHEAPAKESASLDPTDAELNEAFKAGAEGRRYVPKGATVSAPTTIDATQSAVTPLDVDENGEVEYNEPADQEQYEQYASVLQELAPQTFEEFQSIKSTDSKRWTELEDQYRVLSQYKTDSGSLTAKEIWELDQKTFAEKTEKFAKRYRDRGNIAGAYLNGDFEKVYIAHSQINTEAGLAKGYNGSNRMVILKNNRRFHYADVNKANGNVRTDTFYDTEAKLFEYFADLYEEKPFTSITMLSERGMCDSCKGVMEQFKKQFPNVTVNVVSNKSVEGDAWGWRRRK